MISCYCKITKTANCPLPATRCLLPAPRSSAKRAALERVAGSVISCSLLTAPSLPAFVVPMHYHQHHLFLSKQR